MHAHLAPCMQSLIIASVQDSAAGKHAHSPPAGTSHSPQPTCKMVSNPKCCPCQSVNSPACVPVRQRRPSGVHVTALMLARTCP